MEQWKDGDITLLACRAGSQANRLPARGRDYHSSSHAKTLNRKRSPKNRSKQFAELVFGGKIKQAASMLSEEGKGGILLVDDNVSTCTGNQSVKEVLKSKYSQPQAADPNACISGTPPRVHPITFEAINANLICSCTLKATGACGPSGLEAYDWRRLCTSFQTASDSLCEALARVAKRLCTTHINPEIVAIILACLLITLDKCPVVTYNGQGSPADRERGYRYKK